MTITSAKGRGAGVANRPCTRRAPSAGKPRSMAEINGSSTDRPRLQKNPLTRPKASGRVVARAGIEPATFRFSGGRSYRLSYLAKGSRPLGRSHLATLTGLEPATFAVTGRRANQLRHRALLCDSIVRASRVPPTGFEPALPP